MIRRLAAMILLALALGVATIDAVNRCSTNWTYPKPKKITIDPSVLKEIFRFNDPAELESLATREEFADRYVSLEHGSFVFSDKEPTETATVPVQSNRDGGMSFSTGASPLKRRDRRINLLAFEWKRMMSGQGGLVGGNATVTYFLTHTTIITVRLWSVWLLLLLYPAWAARLWCQHWRRRSRGCCEDCGYNLTGNTSGICPECGKPVPKRTADAAATVPPTEKNDQA